MFILHGMIAKEAPEGATSRTARALFRTAVIAAYQRLIEEGRIGAWGITGVGEPDAIIETLEDEPAPAVAQCIANLLDSPGGMKRFDAEPRPRDIIATAVRRGVGVLGIRAVQAGALVDVPDRELQGAEAADYARAAAFREIAAGMKTTAAALAHRYALSMSGRELGGAGGQEPGGTGGVPGGRGGWSACGRCDGADRCDGAPDRAVTIRRRTCFRARRPRWAGKAS